MTADPFHSTESLHDAFIAGLQRQLDDAGLGAFILVLANASFETALWDRLGEGVGRGFERLSRQVRSELRAGASMATAQDDQLVFLKLLAIGFGHIDVTELRRPQGWELQYNLVRGLRPARLANEPVHGIRAPFEPHGFNFQRRYLQQEILWRGDLGGRPVSFFYNKFPFVSHHLLMVPEPDCLHPQFLTAEMLEYAWSLLEGLGRRVPGIGMGYNSYGAFASVNHLHLQCFVRDEPLPLEHAKWRHNGGTEDYPAACAVARSVDEARWMVAALHAEQQAYNLLLRPGAAYVLPRRPQGTYDTSGWSTGFAWYEMAGGAVVTRRSDFETLEGPRLQSELIKVSHGVGLPQAVGGG